MVTQTCRFLVISIGLMHCFLITGCNSKPNYLEVSGRVLIDGEPVPGGDIKFVPQGGKPSGGSIDEEGNFKLTCFDGEPGVIPGKHRVEVICSDIINATTLRWNAPKKYANFRTSGLEFEINEPSDSFVIDLSWEGKKPYVEKVLSGGE